LSVPAERERERERERKTSDPRGRHCALFFKRKTWFPSLFREFFSPHRKKVHLGKRSGQYARRQLAGWRRSASGTRRRGSVVNRKLPSARTRQFVTLCSSRSSRRKVFGASTTTARGCTPAACQLRPTRAAAAAAKRGYGGGGAQDMEAKVYPWGQVLLGCLPAALLPGDRHLVVYPSCQFGSAANRRRGAH